MYELIHWLSKHYAMEILIALGVVLVLIDYYFRTDVPAHFGYVCFSGAFFFALGGGFSLAMSLILALLCWGLLELLHFFVFSRFLTNAPGKERADKG